MGFLTLSALAGLIWSCAEPRKNEVVQVPLQPPPEAAAGPKTPEPAGLTTIEIVPIPKPSPPEAAAGSKTPESAELTTIEKSLFAGYTRYRAIEIGMQRTEVEALLGAPISSALEPDQENWYLPQPCPGDWESPFAIGSIGIVYEKSRVARKTWNPQSFHCLLAQPAVSATFHLRPGMTIYDCNALLNAHVDESKTLTWGGTGAHQRLYRFGNLVLKVEVNGPHPTSKVVLVGELEPFEGWPKGSH